MEYIAAADLNRDPAIVNAIMGAAYRIIRQCQIDLRPDPVAFVVTRSQFEAMERTLGAEHHIPSATLYGIQVLVTDTGWSCPSNLTDLRGVDA